MNAVLAVCMFFLSPWGAFDAGRLDLVVAADGSGDYKTVQAAVNAVPYGNDTTVTIVIRKGTYREHLLIPVGKDHIHLVGEDSVRIVYGLHTGVVLAPGDTVNTWTSASVNVDAFAFHATNITFDNDAPLGSGQAVAVKVSGSHACFDRCRFTGNQDVLFCEGPATVEAYYDCYIEGTTDFIFGSATALFSHCLIRSRKNSHVTAPSTPRECKYGFVFIDCRLTADSGIDKVSLGRPWKPYGSATYIRCWMGTHIVPEGWSNWRNPVNEQTARFAEYRSEGPGANPDKRAAWSRQLPSAEDYSQEKILNGWSPPRP
jgi:pectinesterase